MRSLLDYKKSSKDWHYDPSIQSNDCKYVGRYLIDFSIYLNKINWGKCQSALDLYSEDEDLGESLDNISWGKKDHIKYGYTVHNISSLVLSKLG